MVRVHVLYPKNWDLGLRVEGLRVRVRGHIPYTTVVPIQVYES